LVYLEFGHWEPDRLEVQPTHLILHVLNDFGVGLGDSHPALFLYAKALHVREALENEFTPLVEEEPICANHAAVLFEKSEVLGRVHLEADPDLSFVEEVELRLDVKLAVNDLVLLKEPRF
jgi:hypothetical protein